MQQVPMVRNFDGSGSGVDADKLDGLDSTAFALASANTAAATLTAIKTVDGAASGLDADLLDGQEGSYYAAASLIPSDGVGAVSKAVALSSTGTYTGPTASTTKLTWSVTSTSTDAGTSVEPLVHATTMTGVGGVGGRAKFSLNTNVALGGWSNALKGQVTYGATGKTTGLGSAVVAEMTLSAGTVDGTYAPVEIELNMGTAGATGTATSLIYASVNDAAKTTFDTSGYLMNLTGVTAGASKMFSTVGTACALADFTHGLRIKIGSTDYMIPLITAAEFAS